MIHVFDNNIKVFDSHLLPLQRNRYKNNNLHEPIEEKWFLKAIKKTKGSFVDIGAGIGYYSMLAKKVKPKLRVIAYEPSQVNFNRMADNIKLNNSTFIEMRRVAISSKRGTARFKEGLYGSVLSPKGQNEVSIEKLIDNHEEIGVCKVDVQGHEYEVLKGSDGCKVLTWIVGTHGPGLHKKCLHWLSKRHKIIYQSHSVPGQPDGLIVTQNGSI